MRPERWLPTHVNDGYEVSDLGRFRSLPRTIQTGNGPRRYQGKVIQSYIGADGYRRVFIGGHLYHAHRLVLTAFAGPPNPGDEARHGPGGRSDNRWPENLRWGTTAENKADMLRHGTCATAKLTEASVLTIRQRHGSGERIAVLAREHGVTWGAMYNVVKGVSWKHLLLFTSKGYSGFRRVRATRRNLSFWGGDHDGKHPIL